MGSKNSAVLQVPVEDFESLKASTKFSRAEIEYLYARFRELCSPRRNTKYLIKGDFEFPSSYALHSLILKEMFGEKTRISFLEFVTFLSLFKAPDSKSSNAERVAMRTKKLKLLFSMYDIDKDGNISKQDLLDIVYRLFSDYTDIKTMLKIVHMVMTEMDLTKTNRISLEDFCKALEIFDMDNLAIKFPVL